MLVALAMVLSYLESLIPALIAVPGMKLGLTNLVVLIALTRMQPKYAFGINLVRIILVSLTFGNMFSLLYSLAGGMLSFLVMYLLHKRQWFGQIGISVAGGVAHNIGQILVAVAVLETSALLYYVPFLILSGTVAGVVIGVICGMVSKRIPKELFTDS